MSFDPTRTATEKCERCGRVVVDASTDFGGFILRPTCQGIKVVLRGETVVYVTEEELRTFLERAYGS